MLFSLVSLTQIGSLPQVTDDLYFKGRQVRTDWKLCEHGEGLTTDVCHCRATDFLRSPQCHDWGSFLWGSWVSSSKESSNPLLRLFHEPTCKYSGVWLGVAWGVIIWDAAFKAAPVSGSAPTPTSNFPLPQDRDHWSWTLSGRILQRLTPGCPPGWEVPYYMWLKFSVTKTSAKSFLIS